MLKCLIINDNLADQLLIKRLLKPIAEFEMALDGRSGLELVNTREHDFVILDLKMPIMGGLEVLENMTFEQRNKTIVMSTIDDGGTIVQCIHRGCNNFLERNVNLPEVEHVLTKMGILKGASNGD